MPPTNPRRNGPPEQPSEQEPSNNLDSGFPALQEDSAATARTKYEDVQEDEILALESIYGDDFQRLDVQGAGVWQIRQPSYRIRLKSRDGPFSLALNVEITATYPKTTPLLSISEDEDLKENTRLKIKHIIATKPKELISAGPIIYDILDLIQNALNQAADSDATALPSLEAERAVHAYEAAEIARAAEAQEQRQKELAEMEQQRVLKDQYQNVLNQRTKATEGRRKVRRASIEEESAEDLSEKTLAQRITFDQRTKVTDSDNNVILFHSVTGKNLIRRGPVAKIYTVRPIVITGDTIPTLVLKQTALKDGTSEPTLRKQLHDLENDLEKIKKISHRNVLGLFDFKVQKEVADDETSGSTESAKPVLMVTLLTEYANKGSLEEILEVAGDLPIARTRAWTIDLLDGLGFLHRNGIVHQDIHAANVLLVRNRFGEITAKLADGGYQKQLHILGLRQNGSPVVAVARSAYWAAPENIHAEHPIHSQKTDVWYFGIVFLNMIFGMNVLQEYTSPGNLVETLDLSPALYEFVRKIFSPDPQKRPRASELTFCEFLATDAQVLATESPTSSSRPSVNSGGLNTPFRPRLDSVSNKQVAFSRYKEDFVEEGKLGKGGYGVVMKVRKKLDGQFYAVKKIVQKRSSTTLTEILKEVRLLSTLSHPYVVRYYNTWTEEVGDTRGNEQAVSSDIDGEEPSDEETSDEESSDEESSDEELADRGSADEDDDEEEESGDNSPDGVSPAVGLGIKFEESSASNSRKTPGDLDYMNSQVKFEYDTEEEEDDDEYGEDGDSGNADEADRQNHRELPVRQTRSSSRIYRQTRTILYIQMEFCARRTLADLIRGELYKEKEQVWRILRQMLEALVYIHGMNVVHRDLKPENVFMDNSENVRIGDFGLATSGQFSSDKTPSLGIEHTEMTRSVGTYYYVAPEVRSSASGIYTSKVDMYSLGVIFFEMCYHSIMGMERSKIMNLLRDANPQLPEDFDMDDKKAEADIILSLVKHNPKERPSASELLRGGKLPQPMEEEKIKQAMAKLSDSDSHDYRHIVNALFSMPANPAKDLAWDMPSTGQPPSNELLLQSIVKDRLSNIFRLHGALETRRAPIFPYAKHYSTTNTVKLLDPSGMVMQLPYDLTLPNARALAKQSPTVLRSFAFGEVFRPAGHVGGEPRVLKEVDFDIVSPDTLDLAMKEAEVIKVMDEIIDNFPSLDASRFSIRLNNADLLRLIFQFCRIDSSSHDAVAEVLSRLNVQWSWPKIRTELRGPLIGISSTSVSDLQQFDFKDTPKGAFKKLKEIFKGSEMHDQASSAIGHLNDVITYLDRFQVKTKYFICPLSSMNQKFYKGGIMFQCINETKKRDVFAAGGRYDSLIRDYRNLIGGKFEGCHAVGFNFAWDKVAMSIASLQQSTGKASLKKREDLNGVWATKRCDVLVACFDATTLRVEGTQLIAKLWAAGISAELAVDTRSPEDLQVKYSKDPHCWHVIIKQDSMLKVKSLIRKDPPLEVDILTSQLITHLLGEIRERDRLEGTHEKARSHRHGSHAADPSSASNHDQEVKIIPSDKNSKKPNRQNIIEQAQEKAASLAHSFLDGPIAAMDTTDKTLNMIRDTRLWDQDSWKQVIQNAPMAERNYIKSIHENLLGFAAGSKSSTKNAFLYNFRTGTCVYYDLAMDTPLHPNGKGKDRDSSGY